MIQTQLKEKHIQTLEDAMIEAKERKVAGNRPGPKLNQRIRVNNNDNNNNNNNNNSELLLGAIIHRPDAPIVVVI